MAQYSVCAVGADRPGILAAIAQRLLAHGADVVESQLAILRGTTMLTLLVEGPEELDPFALGAELREQGDALGLADCTLSELPPTDWDASTRPASHIVSFYGPPQRGIMAVLATALAELDVNVVELQSRLMPPPRDSADELHVLLMEVAPPPGLPDDELATLLRAIARDAGLEIALASLDAEPAS